MKSRGAVIVLSTGSMALIALAAVSLLQGGSALAPAEGLSPSVAGAPPGPLPAMAPAGAEGEAMPVFREWIALGSGCRATSQEPGDVTMERITLGAGPGAVHRARFHLEELHLSSAERAPAEPPAFARECALRLQLGPPPGKRIARVTARTTVVSSKAEGVKLTVLGELKLGVATLGREVHVHQAGAAHSGLKDLFDLAPGATSDEAFPELGCAQGKLVGFDYTWIAERESAAAEVSVELSGDRVLDIDAELTDC